MPSVAESGLWEAEIARRLERLGGGGYPSPGPEALVLPATARGLRGAWIARAAVTRARRAPDDLKALWRRAGPGGEAEAVVRRFVLSAALALAGDAEGREEMARWAGELDVGGASGADGAGEYEDLAREAVSVLAQDRETHRTWLLALLDDPALPAARRRLALRVLAQLQVPELAERARAFLTTPELAREALRVLAAGADGSLCARKGKRGEGFFAAARAAFPGVAEDELLETLARVDPRLLAPVLRGRGERARRAEAALAERFRLSGDPVSGRLLLARVPRAAAETIEALALAFDPPAGGLDEAPWQWDEGEALRRELAASRQRRRILDALCSRLLHDPTEDLPLRAGDAARRLLVGLDPAHILSFLAREDAGEGPWATAQRALLLAACPGEEAEVLLQPLLADRRGLIIDRRGQIIDRRGGQAPVRIRIAELARAAQRSRSR